MQPFDIVILANGEYPTHPLPLHILSQAEIIICCDNAGETYYKNTGKMPTAIVGDGDSLSDCMKQHFRDILHIITEQEYNDLTKATRFAVENFAKQTEALRIAYIGATGKREDHTLGNISLINYYRRTFAIRPAIITDYGTFTSHYQNETIKTRPGQQISIFNLNCRTMKSDGLRWEIFPFTEWWHGTLNEATTHAVSIHADGEYIIFTEHE